MTMATVLFNPSIAPQPKGEPQILLVEEVEETVQLDESVEKVRLYLNAKKSPLADHAEQLLEKKHWRLIIAISAIESSYCKRKLAFNCWGIMKGSGGLRQYESYSEAIDDVDALLERRQQQGRWLTVEAMNCSYVVPCNPNWVAVVNGVLKNLDELIPRADG